MDVDDVFRAATLPSLELNTEAALARTVERGRLGRRRRLALSGVSAIALVAAGLGGVAAVRDGPDDQQVMAGPPPTAAHPTEPEPGDPARWTVDPDDPPGPLDSSFTALVRRIACNSAITGRVLQPGVVESDDEVVITFTVAPDDDGGVERCPSNPPEPYTVMLADPLGDRRLVDGTCRSPDRIAGCGADGVQYRVRSTPPDGDTGVWSLESLPRRDASTFTALVTRLGCNSGVTGRVLPPGIVLTATEVVVTFAVERDLDGGDCPTNDLVPYEVELGEPRGNRRLVDGACRSEEAVSTSFCEDRGIRSAP